jgi:hypothetical protein
MAMALLTDPDRAECSKTFQRDISDARDQLAVLTKADIRAAVNAVDLWIDDNTTAYNSAIPQPARAELTTQQKAELFLVVLRKRVKGL